jgi:hypothetical protein
MKKSMSAFSVAEFLEREPEIPTPVTNGNRDINVPIRIAFFNRACAL